MLNIGVYCNNAVDNVRLREMLRDYTFLQNQQIKTFTINYADEVLTNKISICFIDQENSSLYKQRMLNNDFIHFVIIVKNNNELYYHPKFHYLQAPYERQQLETILDNILSNIKKSSIVMTLPHEGSRRILVEDLNYIDINYRNLCFHEKTQNTNGSILRKSFEKEVQPYLHHEELFLLKPSLLINVSNIDTLTSDHIVFRNGAILYYPKAKYKDLKNYWDSYYFVEE